MFCTLIFQNLEGVMYATQDYATQDIVESANSTARLNIAKGLELRVSETGKKTYFLRASLGGKSTTRKLGTYPEISLEEAKILASERQSEIKKARQERSQESWDSFIKGNKTIKLKKSKKNLIMEKHPSFRYEDDPENFLISLLRSNIQETDKLAILILILIPSHPMELIRSKWCEFTFSISPSTTRSIWTCGIKSNNTQISIPLSHEASVFLDKLRGISYSGNSLSPLFPEWSELNYIDLKKKIFSTINLFWKNYPVTLTTLRNYFIVMAEMNSGFKFEFIRDVIIDKRNNLLHSQDFAFQRRALFDWWGYRMNKYL